MSLTISIAPEDMLHVGNEISITLKTSLPSTTANLRIACFLNVELVYDSGSYVTYANQTLTPDADGKCKFFWNRFLNDAFEKKYDVPAVNGTTPFKTQYAIKRYRMSAIEYSGDPQGITHLLTTGDIANTRFAMQGGIPKHRRANLPFFGASGWNFSSSPIGLGKAFLDWRGPNPRTRITEDQWMYYIWQDPGGAFGNVPLKLKGTLYRSDGLEINGTFYTSPVMFQFDCYGFPVGFNQLGLSTYETATDKIYKYKMWITYDPGGGDVVLSEIKTWHVDRKYYERTTELQYLNTLGVMVQMTLRGNLVRKNSIDREVTPQYYEYGDDVDQGENFLADQLVRTGGEIFTGSVSRDEAKMFMELITSRKVLYSDRYQNNYPLQIKNAKYEEDLLENVLNYQLEVFIDFNDTVPDLFV